ncbi:MAG: sulfate ABC transporter permease subunit CysT [Oscillatoriales cyanobacterium]|nr:MAG: sulfate ABC transporter permease subunit CysT [Oscillatoriales cyanobacterium]
MTTTPSPAATRRFPKLPLSIPWQISIIYTALLLILPFGAMFGKSATLSPSQFWEIATDPVAIATYKITFGAAFLAAVFNGFVGFVVAWVLERYDFPGKRWFDAAIDLPFALPTAVAGLTLATIYSENGWIGSLFAPLKVRIAFTSTGVWVAMLFISLPFVVRTLQPVLREIEPELEEAAWSLGASPWQTFSRVLFPPLLPATITGVTLGFARAVGEFGSIVLIASNIPFEDMVASVLIFQKLEQYDFEGATVIGTTMLLISLALLLVINALQAWGRRYRD